MDIDKDGHQYEQKFKNRGRIYKHISDYRKGGNAYSTKKSRPGYMGQQRANYLVEKRNLDIPDYSPVKVDPKESAKVMRSGGALPPGPNCGADAGASRAKAVSRALTPRCCHLDDIHPRLYIANNDYLQSTEIDGVIINLTDKQMAMPNRRNYRFCRSRRDHYNVGYRDCRQITTGQFRAIYSNCKNIIDSSEGKDIYLICNKGINRSVSIAVQYAIDSGHTYGWTVNCIEKQKQQCDPNWDTLTNPRLRRILQS